MDKAMDYSGEQQFNPFEDRFSRDLRNDLSEGFAVLIETGDSGTLYETIRQYRDIELTSCYQDYLNKRIALYDQALKVISDNNYVHPIQNGIVLFNHTLFFEMHEVLEHQWYEALEGEKLVLQALIRAAGVYIKKEFGFHDAAERIADKATHVLSQYRESLADLFTVDDLISALQNLENPPPPLTIF